ncbi:hypothetical protein RIF29_10540 [Crotalaria pallida]|uniref:Uncharacterized protein n=1 Tax=Crotalaria pallida TaxID=3830 RepID=A0AAN9FZ06_CROPI
MYKARKQKEEAHRALRPPLVINRQSTSATGSRHWPYSTHLSELKGRELSLPLSPLRYQAAAPTPQG